MKAFSTIVFFLSFCNTTGFCQTVKLDWAKQMRGGSYEVCQAITLDDDGNIYATGYYSTTVDFDPGPGVFNLTSANAEDIFLSKYDPTGKLIWAKSIGGFRYQAGYAITLDLAKNIYITGIFFGSLDFDPGPGVTTLSSAGNEDVFISKFDNDANFIWAIKLGGVSNDYSNAIIVDRSGNIYLNGYFDGTSDFDPGTGVFNMTSLGSTDIYVCKLDNSGNFLWAKRIGGTTSEAAYSIGLDVLDNIYATGFFWGTVDFDPGTAVFNLVSNGFGDGFILKLNTNGSFIKAGKLGGNHQVRCTSLKLDHSGFMYVTGHFDGDADFDIGTGTALLSSPIGEEDVFVAKYDLNFDLVWVKQIRGPSFQKAFSVDVDANDNVYVTGHYKDATDFDPGPDAHTLVSVGDPDVFVLKLNSTGEFVWVAHAAGLFYGSGYTIKVDQANNIYVGGTFEGTKDFDPGPDEFKLTSAGESDIFIEKLKQCPNAAITTTLNINSCTSYTLNNKTYDSSGSYINIVLNEMGCDSIIINLNLTITRAINNLPVSICQGQNYFAGGRLQTKTGVYYDTLKTAAGCDSVLVTALTVNPSPKPNLGVDRNICEGQTIILNPGNFNTYLWHDQSTQPVFATASPGTYRVTVTNQFNCVASARVILKNIVPLPKDFLPQDQSLCSGNVLKINVPGYKNYTWNTGSSASNIEIRTPGNYFLTVTDHDNCVGGDSIVVQEINCIPVGIPNAFTPNNDGKNDYFRPVLNLEVHDYHMRIYNRNGQLIFQTKDHVQGWDGRFKNQQLEAGAYVYHITFASVSGSEFENSGTILLLR
jgi:gliding motility-associated-like protein